MVVDICKESLHRKNLMYAEIYLCNLITRLNRLQLKYSFYKLLNIKRQVLYCSCWNLMQE
jgi:hypothetical protein